MPQGGGRQYATDRQVRLVELLKLHGYRSVTELAATLQVSPMTVRRDLQALAVQGIVQVSHGGARIPLQPYAEADFAVRSHEHAREKDAIGRLAATLIEPGDVIGLDGGSSTVEIARHLPALPLTVVTYSLPVTTLIEPLPRVELLLLGGMLHRETQSFTGPQVLAALRHLRLTKLFLATSGMLIPDGLSSSFLHDSEVKRAMIESARQVILCMDSSKIGQVFLAHFATLDQVDVLVTDDLISPEDQAALERCNVQVLLASHNQHDREMLAVAHG